MQGFKAVVTFGKLQFAPKELPRTVAVKEMPIEGKTPEIAVALASMRNDKPKSEIPAMVK